MVKSRSAWARRRKASASAGVEARDEIEIAGALGQRDETITGLECDIGGPSAASSRTSASRPYEASFYSSLQPGTCALQSHGVIEHPGDCAIAFAIASACVGALTTIFLRKKPGQQSSTKQKSWFPCGGGLLPGFLPSAAVVNLDVDQADAA